MKQLYKKPTRAVSERMRVVRSSGTSLEKKMEKHLKTLNIKYQRQPEIFGHPDFRINGTNVLIFCDSSFWHGRREVELTGKAFGRNRLFWAKKLQETKKRDIRISRALRKMGWSVYRFWDNDIHKKSDKVIKKLKRAIYATRQ